MHGILSITLSKFNELSDIWIHKQNIFWNVFELLPFKVPRQ